MLIGDTAPLSGGLPRFCSRRMLFNNLTVEGETGLPAWRAGRPLREREVRLAEGSKSSALANTAERG